MAEFLVLCWEEDLKVYSKHFSDGAAGNIIIFNGKMRIRGGRVDPSWAHFLRQLWKQRKKDKGRDLLCGLAEPSTEPGGVHPFSPPQLPSFSCPKICLHGGFPAGPRRGVTFPYQ
jgi:hypothetical protein